MKRPVLFILLVIALTARAETQTMKDKGSANLAKMLKGHSLVCDSLNGTNQEKGFFPLTVSAKPLGQGKTELSVVPADPKVGFGYGGESFDDVEQTETWTIISCGDDGRNFLQFQNFADDVFKPNSGYFCDPKSSSGEIAGILTGIWDAGTIQTEAVSCCVKK